MGQCNGMWRVLVTAAMLAGLASCGEDASVSGADVASDDTQSGGDVQLQNDASDVKLAVDTSIEADTPVKSDAAGDEQSAECVEDLDCADKVTLGVCEAPQCKAAAIVN